MCNVSQSPQSRRRQRKERALFLLEGVSAPYSPERNQPENKTKAAVVWKRACALGELRSTENYFGKGLSRVMGLKLGGEEQEWTVLHILTGSPPASPHRHPPGRLTRADLRLQLIPRGGNAAAVAP